jgi:hypothetical protein
LSSDEHQIVSVPEAALTGKTNGQLLALAQASFDLFITLIRDFRIGRT